MSDTEAPAAPVTPPASAPKRRGRPPGKKTAPASDVDARLAALDTKFDTLMAAIAKMTAPAVTQIEGVHRLEAATGRAPDEILPPSAPVSASKGVEAAYVYMTRQGKDRVRVNVRIEDPEDEKWEGELLQAPFNGDPMGAIEVAFVTRVDGEIVKSKDIFGGPSHMNVARAFLRQFAAAKAKGSDKPWDVERYWRDKKDEEARLKREGKVDELLAMRTLMVEALKGVLTTESAGA